MKGRIFTYTKYKAYTMGMLTSRVSPKNTSRECAWCHHLIARYHTGHPAEGYTPGAPLAFCPCCGMKGNADRNASLVIGQRLRKRYDPQEKPQALRRVLKNTGVAVSQDAGCEEGPSILIAGHGDTNEHGIAQDAVFRMDEHPSDIPHQLRFLF
ncbi:zinc ribbon domain-containing protein [Dictyobacter halimunensis]|uniref:zinc ribbon domain-containing protein n=1 Tax=Dictyobacter halimunensis TaxID=3026934 RepID=UPI0030C6AF3C